MNKTTSISTLYYKCMIIISALPIAEICMTETLSIISHPLNFIRKFEQYYNFWDANLFILFKIFDHYLGSLLAKLLVLF